MNGCCCRSDAASSVEHIIGSYKAISIEGGFRLHNLMGVKAKSVPVVTSAGRDRPQVRAGGSSGEPGFG